MPTDFAVVALTANLRKEQLQRELQEVIETRRQAFAYLHHVEGQSFAVISRNQIRLLEEAGVPTEQIDGMGVLHDNVRADIRKAAEPVGGWQALVDLLDAAT